MNKKLVAIIEGALLIVIGVLAAVFGGGQVMDIVFGVLFVVGGAALGALACATTVKTKILPLNMMATAVGFLFFGILLLAKLPSHYVTTVSPVIHYAMIAAAGLGVALFIKGLHVLIAKKIVFTGIGQMVIGAAVAAVAIVWYLNRCRRFIYLLNGFLWQRSKIIIILYYKEPLLTLIPLRAFLLLKICINSIIIYLAGYTYLGL